jgi:hypothetical protein
MVSLHISCGSIGDLNCHLLQRVIVGGEITNTYIHLTYNCIINNAITGVNKNNINRDFTYKGNDLILLINVLINI